MSTRKAPWPPFYVQGVFSLLEFQFFKHVLVPQRLLHSQGAFFTPPCRLSVSQGSRCHGYLLICNYYALNHRLLFRRYGAIVINRLGVLGYLFRDLHPLGYSAKRRITAVKEFGVCYRDKEL